MFKIATEFHDFHLYFFRINHVGMKIFIFLPFNKCQHLLKIQWKFCVKLISWSFYHSTNLKLIQYHFSTIRPAKIQRTVNILRWQMKCGMRFIFTVYHPEEISLRFRMRISRFTGFTSETAKGISFIRSGGTYVCVDTPTGEASHKDSRREQLQKF